MPPSPTSAPSRWTGPISLRKHLNKTKSDVPKSISDALPVNCFEGDIWQLGQCVGLDELVECLHDLLVLAVVHRAPGVAADPHGGDPGLGAEAGGRVVCL